MNYPPAEWYESPIMLEAPDYCHTTGTLFPESGQPAGNMYPESGQATGTLAEMDEAEAAGSLKGERTDGQIVKANAKREMVGWSVNSYSKF